ncbi:DEAD/DEAH box helicase [Clostridium manihotivorum]|uniref:DEAD/DEAH box helicase n=2 Tax=Clostridium manihotivorum TaxID=2320868 RepID=A0A3R5QVD0_9CLOT|nr:DEAD/DEAH box helicase [Clostridium manihotivorum]
MVDEMSIESKGIKLASGAEDKFIELFSEVFGPEKTNNLAIQYGIEDIYGRSRYIDFAIVTDNEKVAIEIDGEGVHEPGKISHEKYYDDLLKQNSIIYKNWKLYRWTDGQMKKYPDKVKDEMVTFLGDLMEQNISEYLPSQKGSTLELREHQEEALESLKNLRAAGDTIALLYHATGTGKTVTAVEDAKSIGKRTLFIAHTKELITQANEKFKELWSDASCGIYMGDIKEKEAHVVCASIQSISQNLKDFNAEDFDYIIIDEAHHGTAASYKDILSYFKPSFTLGLTATPERTDGEDLLEIFKNVAHKLDIKTAVEKGILAEIRCIRIKTNIDISDVRIRGIKYDSKDLESKLFVPERNNVIVDTYINYVKDKRTVVFCASVNNAEDIAELFRKKGIRAEAVSGGMKQSKREKVLKDYEAGEVKVLCACDLLNEGWDSPRTEVLFMARPTMSKVIYMQQLGRGTRKAEGKDYLLVFDFIDNANLFNMPLSAHRMFNLADYIPGGLVLGNGNKKRIEDDVLRRGEKPVELIDLPVDVLDYEHIDLFNWNIEAQNMISQMEFVRRVDVQSETIARYIREGKIVADLEVPCGNTSFKYFKEETLIKYAQEFNWDIINDSNIKEKFIDFVEKMDMSYSYKPVLLMAMLEQCDDNGKVLVEDVVDYFIDYYEDRKCRGLQAEKKKSLYNDEVIDRKKAKANIFSNPFKRFEDMRFLEKCKDIEYIQFNKKIWKKLSGEEKKWIYRRCEERIGEYFGEI